MAWTVDYGDGPQPVTLPHCWRQDVPVGWEGPATYRTRIPPLDSPHWLLFEGVSCHARVFLDGRPIGEHLGIWDAFSIPLPVSGAADLAVEVTKNGGASFPVGAVASGFLPYVFHTFGGIYRPARLVRSSLDPLAEVPSAPATRASIQVGRVLIDGRPIFIRGLLHWGWYPELGAPTPDEERIRSELEAARDLGFNLVKFCLWVPPHRYLELLEEYQMLGWMELPAWMPGAGAWPQIAAELERIVRQYRRHRSIVIWTGGCELGAAATYEQRRELVEMLRRETGCPLIRDDSGGAEMYGGDLRECGSFWDFHPYCDLPFYPPVLASLLPGARPLMPVLLGECVDADVHRDLRRLQTELPFWASTDELLNAQGVRWQHDLPRAMQETWPEDASDRLLESTTTKAAFIRKAAIEGARSLPGVSGYVLTGWRDTPISSSGFFDDWGAARFRAEETRCWNAPICIFPIPYRRPPWRAGGNRPGWLDFHCHFAGRTRLLLGMHAESGWAGRIDWLVRSDPGQTIGSGSANVEVEPMSPEQILAIDVDLRAGSYELMVRAGEYANRWSLWVEEPCADAFELDDPAGHFFDLRCASSNTMLATRVPPEWRDLAGAGKTLLAFLDREGTLARPFWRESGYEWLQGSQLAAGFEGQWERLLALSGDRALDPAWLESQGIEGRVLLTRIDVRSYERLPMVVEARVGVGRLVVSTLRPFAGLGSQPGCFGWNPAGHGLIRALLAEPGPNMQK